MYFIATSELFWQPTGMPQYGMTPFFPWSTYAVSKLARIWTVCIYKGAYKLFMVNGILFNHESDARIRNL